MIDLLRARAICPAISIEATNPRNISVHTVHGAPPTLEMVSSAHACKAICRSLEQARAAFEVAIEEKPAGRLMIRSRIRVVKRHPFTLEILKFTFEILKLPCARFAFPAPAEQTPDPKVTYCEILIRGGA